MGIEEAIDMRIKNLDIYGDLTLVINQIKGEWETRHPGLIPYKDYVRRLPTFCNKVELHHIPHHENQMVDALATLSSMYKVITRMTCRRLASNVLRGVLVCLQPRKLLTTSHGSMISSVSSKIKSIHSEHPTKTRRL